MNQENAWPVINKSRRLLFSRVHTPRPSTRAGSNRISVKTFVPKGQVEADFFTKIPRSSGDTILNSLRRSRSPSTRISVVSPITRKPIPALGGSRPRPKGCGGLATTVSTLRPTAITSRAENASQFRHMIRMAQNLVRATSQIPPAKPEA